MEKAKVYYSDLRTSPTSNLLDKMERLLKRAGIEQLPLKDSFAAIKIHFGEPGNLAYLRPNYAARMATLLRSLGAKPFLTDCNTLYSGRRANAVDHLQSAMENGFNPISAQCQVIIGDGLKGTDYREIPLNGEYCPAPKIGTAIADADIVISMNHFKGHEQAGFGGALGRGGSGEKKSALSTSTSSGSLRLMPRWMCRGPSSLFWGWICSFSSNIGVHSFGCVCRHVVGMMLSTARAGRQVAVWSSSLSQPKDSQMWSGQGESTKRAAPSWILMWTV